MKKPTLLILAAGIGSRYGGLKQIDKIGPSGEAIIDYSIFDGMRAGFGKVVMVIRKELEADFRDFFDDKIKGKLNIQYVYQELDNLPEGVVAPAGRVKPWGTAHAVLVASEVINEPFMVINADDFY
jgi:dTDP-glucose pyrophosphorylase